jgi:hypothetical protein
MEGIPQELVIVGGVLLVGLAVLLIARYAKQILLFLLVAGGVAVVVLIGWALIQKPGVIPEDTAETVGDVADIVRFLTPKDEPAAPAPAPTYSTPAPSGGGFLSGLLAALLIVALCVAGYFGLRWKLAEWGGKRRATSRRELSGPQGQPPIVYVIEADDGDGLADLWDLEGLTEWNEDELTLF